MLEHRLSLYELNGLVRQTIELSLNDFYWVEAELAELRVHRGNCYMELVQKDEVSNTPIAKASAKCWRTEWFLLQSRFVRVTGQEPRAGMKMLLKVSAQFHEQYGFSWIVDDIDPTYTIGDMARRRQEIIKRLKDEGVFDLNKQLEMPMFTQRIAVISSNTAAGYGDFADQLLNNQYGFAFSLQLFQATMQGEQVEQSVVNALNLIYERAGDFDCVVIIRGGGATSDMSGFDTLMLAENVANFPLPIITGIGHERDECVLDLVAHTRMKTPTAVAAFLIDRLVNIHTLISQLETTIINSVRQQIKFEKMRLQRLASVIPHIVSAVKLRQESRLDQIFKSIEASIKQRIAAETSQLILVNKQLQLVLSNRLSNENHRIALIGKRLELSDPRLLLKRGYSITTLNGKTIISSEQLAKGDKIETLFADGQIKSVVE